MGFLRSSSAGLPSRGPLGLLLFLLSAGALLASSGDRPEVPSEPAWGTMVMQLLGGLALFLFGMEQMAGGLKSAAGAKVKDILARFTSNRVKAALTGATVTAIIQSSSVTTVLVVGFVSAGLMSLAQSVGIIMGANVGTTITAQIVAFKVTKGALGMIAIGFTMLFVSKRDRVKQAGNILMGLGLVFFGMAVMSEAMYPLRSYQPFIDLMTRMQNPLLGILAGAVFTALVQSSSATTGVVIALASQGLLSLPAGIALIFGANIGTCVTAMLASIGKSREARRVALVHVIFNVTGVVLWVFFIPLLAGWVEGFSPKHADLEGHARLAAEVPRQIANAHAMFNITNTVILLPFTSVLAAISIRLVPDRPEEPLIKTKFLDEDAIEVPALAINNARLETGHLGEVVCGMMDRLRETGFEGIPGSLDAIEKDDDLIDTLEAEILRYLAAVRQRDLTSQESDEFQAIMMTTDALESIGDVISEDLVAIERHTIEAQLHPTESMRGIMRSLWDSTRSCLGDVIAAFRDEDPDAAQVILERQGEIDKQVEAAYHHQEHRFHGTDTDRLDIFRTEMKAVEKLRRIYSLTKRIARAVIATKAESDSKP